MGFFPPNSQPSILSAQDLPIFIVKGKGKAIPVTGHVGPFIK
jgi:hypothetical protein